MTARSVTKPVGDTRWSRRGRDGTHRVVPIPVVLSSESSDRDAPSPGASGQPRHRADAAAHQARGRSTSRGGLFVVSRIAVTTARQFDEPSVNIVSHGQLLRVGREPDAQEATNRHCRLHAVGSPRRMWWRFPTACSHTGTNSPKTTASRRSRRSGTPKWSSPAFPSIASESGLGSSRAGDRLGIRSAGGDPLPGRGLYQLAQHSTEHMLRRRMRSATYPADDPTAGAVLTA